MKGAYAATQVPYLEGTAQGANVELNIYILERYVYSQQCAACRTWDLRLCMVS